MRYRKKVKGLTSEGHFDERHAALYFVDILHGLAYLHRYVTLECGYYVVLQLHRLFTLYRNILDECIAMSIHRNRICHRDLKPENIL